MGYISNRWKYTWLDERKYLIMAKLTKRGQTPTNRDGTQTNECAAFVNGELYRNGIKSYGDAYDING